MNSDRVFWLERAYVLLRNKYLPEAPQSATVTFGFTYHRPGKKDQGKPIGQYWNGLVKTETPEEKNCIILHPYNFDDPIKVLAVLLHEIIHAAVPDAGHRAPFSKLAKRVGLCKPWTATSPSPELVEELTVEILPVLGKIPSGHGDINEEESRRKKQKTRLRKWQCPCRQIVRVAKDDWNAQCLDCGGQYEMQDQDGGE
jgi:hypothetical protein